MHRDDEHFPFRQATRLVNEFQVAVAPIGLDLVDRHLDRMIVLLVMLRTGLRRHVEPGISMHAMATSLGRPPETIRRHVRALADLGYCRQVGRTMRLTAGFADQPRIVEGGIRLATLFGHLLDGSSGPGSRSQPAFANSSTKP